MTKTFAELQTLCSQHRIDTPPQRRPAKEPLVLALRNHLWSSENPGRPLPEQIEPLLLGDWNDLDESDAIAIEADNSGWCVQEKHDGVRALLHVTADGVRITSRNISEVTFRLNELAPNLPHLTEGFEHLAGTVIDGELVCPKSSINTGDTTTSHVLQAAVAILAASPEKAIAIQTEQDARLRFVAFDVLRFQGRDITSEPLSERLKILDTVYLMAENAFIQLVETQSEAKAFYHEMILSEGKEGTVWKKLDKPYEPGKRVHHWLKRKKGIEVIAAVTGFKPGTKGKGNEHLVGAIEFSTPGEDGSFTPIAWVSSWSDEERREMTRLDDGIITLNPKVLGQKAVIGGHDIAGKSGRFRHARIIKWLDSPSHEAQCVTRWSKDEFTIIAA
jgi:ATP-dependent DNA ligase